MFPSRAELIILLESPDDERAFLFSEELGVVWEILNDEKRGGPSDDSDQALEDEDPRPAWLSADSVHVRDCGLQEDVKSIIGIEDERSDVQREDLRRRLGGISELRR